MSRSVCARWGMTSLLIVSLGVCPAWGEDQGGAPLVPEGAAQVVAWQPTTGDSEVSLTGAVSRRSHGLAGEFDVDLPLDSFADAGVEPRVGGPTQVLLTFSGPADGLNVQASTGSVDAILVEGAQARVELSGVPNATCLVLAVSGVAGMESETWVRIRVLAGDVNADGTVNVLDLMQVRNHLNQQATAANFRSDVTADGAINVIDLVQVRNRLNTLAACPWVDMVPIPAGEFLMGNSFTGEGDSDELPRHAVDVDAFYMDRYEVTNQQYADGLNWAWNQGNLISVTNGIVYKSNTVTSSPYCDTTSSSSYSRITWNGSTFGVVASKEQHPMVQVSWHGAVAYSNWRSAMEGRTPCYDLDTWACDFNANGYRLPSEAEWEKAARGGAAGRRFPWSDQDAIQHARANYYSYWSGGAPYSSYDTSPTQNYHPVWGVGSAPYPSPVGFFDGSLRHKADCSWPGSETSYQTVNAANDYGLHDMAGNVYEWCNDWYGSSYYSSSPYSNPRGPAAGLTRVLRGGSWRYYAYSCRVAARYLVRPAACFDNFGFRCAAGN